MHGDAGRAGTLDLRAHRDQELREVHDLGLARRTLDNGGALRERGRGHHVGGAEHRGAEGTPEEDGSPD